jgi:hypothetical protein
MGIENLFVIELSGADVPVSLIRNLPTDYKSRSVRESVKYVLSSDADELNPVSYDNAEMQTVAKLNQLWKDAKDRPNDIAFAVRARNNTGVNNESTRLDLDQNLSQYTPIAEMIVPIEGTNETVAKYMLFAYHAEVSGARR